MIMEKIEKWNVSSLIKVYAGKPDQLMRGKREKGI